MLTSIWKHPFQRFLLLAVGMLILWYLLYSLLLQGSFIDHVIIDNLSDISTWLLQSFGYETLAEVDSNIRTVGIEGGHPLWIGDECDGLTLFAIFSIIIAAFPGPWKKKLWFIPLGILLIHILNIIRITALVIIVKYYPDSLDFNHTYVFQTIVYLFIFGLWYWWAKKFAGAAFKPVANKPAE